LRSTRHDQNPSTEPVIVPMSTVADAFRIPGGAQESTQVSEAAAAAATAAITVAAAACGFRGRTNTKDGSFLAVDEACGQAERGVPNEHEGEAGDGEGDHEEEVAPVPNVAHPLEKDRQVARRREPVGQTAQACRERQPRQRLEPRLPRPPRPQPS